MEEICPVDLLAQHSQQTFARYRLSCFLIGYKEKMASYHHYFNNTGSGTCTGMVEIMADPNFVNEWFASFKKLTSVF